MADETVALAEVLVAAPGRHHADAQLGDDVGRAGDGRPPVVGQHNAEGRAGRRRHALGEAADDSQPRRVDVHQPQLAQPQPVGAGQETVDEFRGIGRAAADDCDLHG